jgi:hypothetical protein
MIIEWTNMIAVMQWYVPTFVLSSNHLKSSNQSISSESFMFSLRILALQYPPWELVKVPKSFNLCITVPNFSRYWGGSRPYRPHNFRGQSAFGPSTGPSTGPCTGPSTGPFRGPTCGPCTRGPSSKPFRCRRGRRGFHQPVWPTHGAQRGRLKVTTWSIRQIL